MALKNGDLTDETEITRHRRRIAANVGDPKALRLILGIDPEEFARFYPDMTRPGLSTDDTIDSFLSRFGKEDASLTSAVAEIPLPEPTAQNVHILIKNHDYEAALEIIMRLSLNNPKKSIYFADQIRFLRKLILNESKK